MIIDHLKAKATAAIEQGNLSSARPLWTQVCELDPIDIDNWLILSSIDEHLGFQAAALEHLQYAFQLSPDSVDVWLQSARLKWQMQQFPTALSDIQIAASHDFTDLEIRAQLAQWHQSLLQFDQALTHWRYLLLIVSVDTDDSEDSSAEVVEVIVHAAMCAWFEDDIATLSRAYDLVSPSFIDDIAREIARFSNPDRPLKSAPEVHEPDLQAWVASVQQAVEKHTIAADFYDTVAATRDSVVTSDQKYIMQALATQAAQVLTQIDDHAPTVVELGSYFSHFGQSLSQQRPSSNQVGVFLSQRCFEQMGKNTHLDVALNWDQWLNWESTMLPHASCVVLSSCFFYYPDIINDLERLIDVLSDGCVLLLPLRTSDSKADTLRTKIQTKPGWQLTEHTIDQSMEFSIWKVSAETDDSSQTVDKNPCGELVRQREEHGNNLIQAQMQFSQGQIVAAETIASQVGKQYPRATQALYLMAVGAQHRKENPEALALLRATLRTDWKFVDAWFQLATVWHALGKEKAMLRAYGRCLALNPGHSLALSNLLLFYTAKADIATALNVARTLLLAHPLDAQLTKLCDDVAEQERSGEIKQGIQLIKQSKEWVLSQFQAALTKKYFNRASDLLKDLSSLYEPLEWRAMQVTYLEKSGQMQMAISKALELYNDESDNINHLKTLRALYLQAGCLIEAHQQWLTIYKRYSPDDTDFQGGLFASNYYSFVADQQIAEYHFRWGRELQALTDKSLSTQMPARVSKTDETNKKIRIGYVSGDFKTHSVALFLYNLYLHHDKDAYEVFSYSTVNQADNMTIKLRLFSECWRDISQMSNLDAAALIKRDRIDILIDLSGHTGHNRLPLFAFRPAPVQCTYLGYANTTGLPAIDYRFTDAIADPDNERVDSLHSETLIRLPEGFLSYSKHFGSPPVVIDEAEAAPRRYTFVCCNNISKVNENVVRVFAEILLRLPQANILIKAHNLDNDFILNRYYQQFASHGVEQDRVHLMNAIDIAEHEQLYNHTLMALDPFPYNGTTTTCDALWMGVPVLTLAGTRHCARVGASILAQLGLSDWIADDEQQYIEKAVRFAQDKTALGSIRLELRYRMRNSSLMQPERVCRALEKEYQRLYKG